MRRLGALPHVCFIRVTVVAHLSPSRFGCCKRNCGEMRYARQQASRLDELRHGEGECIAAFVSVPTASRRAPATHSCASPDEAREWIQVQAAALGIPVEWTDRSPAQR